MPPEACGRVFTDHQSDQITLLNGKVVGQVLKIETVAGQVVGKAGLGNHIYFGVLVAVGLIGAHWELV